METLEQVKDRMAVETAEAYRACPYSFSSRDYFARFNRDPDASPGAADVALGPEWRLVVPAGASPLAMTMTTHLSEFLSQRMGMDLPVEAVARQGISHLLARLLDRRRAAQEGQDEQGPTSAPRRDRG